MTQSVPTVVDSRTGTAVPVYIGADPPEQTPTPATEEPNNDDASVTKTDGTGAATTGNDTADSAASDSVAKDDDASGERLRDDKGQFIPKPRFNEVNERMKAAEAELARIKAEQEAAKQAAESAYDFDAAEKDYANLVLDGKVEEAIAKRKEIRAAEQEHYKRVATETTTTVTKQQSVNDAIAAIGEQYERDYDLFNPTHENFNADVMDDVKGLYRANLESGKFESTPAAFENALQKVLRLHGVQIKSPSASPTAAPARTAKTRVEAIANQPPMIGKTGVSSPTHGEGAYKVSELSEAQTLALPEATRRRLRGDFV